MNTLLMNTLLMNTLLMNTLLMNTLLIITLVVYSLAKKFHLLFVIVISDVLLVTRAAKYHRQFTVR